MNDRNTDTPVRNSIGPREGAHGQECPRYVPFRGFNAYAEVDRHRRNLPHWQQPGACYFVTFRLGDALPRPLLDQWREERALWLRWNPEPWSEQQRNEYHERFTERQQEWLDAGSGACYLRRPEVRERIRGSVMKFDAIRYYVDAFVLMPNHVHLLWQMRANFDLTKELKALKGASARVCNLLLGLGGTFWMEESYDRIVRDRDELAGFRRYIADNPTKARLNANEFTLEIFDRLEVLP